MRSQREENWMILANSLPALVLSFLICAVRALPSLVGILAPHGVGQAESSSLMATAGLLRHSGNGPFEPSSFQCWGMDVGVGWCWEVQLPR